MKCRRKPYHRNPTAAITTALIAPVLPYAVVGVVLYFYGGKIAALLGAKISGVDTTQFKADASTVKQGLSTPWQTAKGLLTATTGIGYISPADQKKALTKIAANLKPNEVKSTTGDLVSKVAAEVTKATIKTKTVIAKAKPVIKSAALKQATSVTSGLQTIKTATPVEIKGAFSNLFGGIFSKPAPAYISQDAQQAALARIKAENGFK
jgi:hypothetical protein